MTFSNDYREMEDKFDELKRYFNAKLAQQEENITAIFNNLLTDLRIQINREIQNEVNK